MKVFSCARFISILENIEFLAPFLSLNYYFRSFLDIVNLLFIID